MADPFTIADHLDTVQAEILSRWVERVRADDKIPETAHQDRAQLVDHFPAMLHELTHMLRTAETRETIEKGNLASVKEKPVEHARLRFEHGYEVGNVLREIAHLRYVLIQELHRAHFADHLAASLLIHSALDDLAETSAQIISQYQNQLLQAVISRTDQGIAVTTRAGDFKLINPVAEKLFEKGRGDISDEDWQRSFGLYSADGTPLTRDQVPLHRALAGEKVAGTYQIRHKDGSILWIELNAGPLLTGENKAMAAVVLFRDVTEQKNAMETLRQTATFREQFIGILAHDLKNPLTAIQGFGKLALLHKDDPLPAFKNDALMAFEKIDHAAKRIGRMIGDVLDFTQSRLGSGLRVKWAPCDLAQLFRQGVDEQKATYPDRVFNLTLTGDLQGEWDSERLLQVLSNLITNAVKYSPAESVIQMNARDEGNTVCFSVQNQGEPIPSSQLAQIFEPFRRAPSEKGGQQAGGLGLGLFIVRSIVNAHQGTVQVESTQERGTTFSIRLPKHPRKEGR